jgi:hypothetical protein
MPDAAAASDAILSTRTCAGSRGQEIHKKGGKNKNKFLSTIRALSRQIKEFLFFFQECFVQIGLGFQILQDP